MKNDALAIITSSKKEPASKELISGLLDAQITPYLTQNGTITVTSDGTRLTLNQDK